MKDVSDVSEGVLGTCKRACPRQAKHACIWKSGGALPESNSDSPVESTKKVFDISDQESDIGTGQLEMPSITPLPWGAEPSHSRATSTSETVPLLDFGGLPLFVLDDVHFP